MTGNSKFTELLNTYVAGNATNEQYNELMRMIKSGDFDDLLRKRIDEAMLHNNLAEELDENRTQELLMNILNSEKNSAKIIPFIKPAQKYRRWYIAAAAIVALAFAIWALLPGKNEDRAKLANNEKKVTQPVAGKNEKKYVRLPDGSTVLLNEGSSIESPEVFGNATREVVLKGEGYFDIRHEAGRPFIVHTGHVSTTVLGTAFNIRAYPGQREVTVTVTRGRVKVSNDEKTIGVITPNESIAVNLDDKSFRQKKVNAEDVVEWKKQYLVLDDITLEDAAILIDSKYHVKISFSNNALRECRIQATFLNNESLEQVLEVVSGVVNADYTIQPNDQVIISGSGCK